MNRVLIIEDEGDISRLLQMHLQAMDLPSDVVSSGEEALTQLSRNNYDLLILDWMLPGLSGVELARVLRKMDSLKDVAILMVTAKSDAESIVSGLEAGADDYLAKPFQGDVLKARVNSLLRRTQRLNQAETGRNHSQDELTMGPLKVSLKSYKAYLDGEIMNLTPSEFKLLTTMMEFRGRVLTRAKLIEEVQGAGISVIGRTVDTHIFGLRRKLGPHADLIETVRGIGYRVRDDLY